MGTVDVLPTTINIESIPWGPWETTYKTECVYYPLSDVWHSLTEMGRRGTGYRYTIGYKRYVLLSVCFKVTKDPCKPGVQCQKRGECSKPLHKCSTPTDECIETIRGKAQVQANEIYLRFIKELVHAQDS